MATYDEIQKYVFEKYGYKPKNCWIAHMKEMCGLNPKMSNNRQDPNSRVHPCPVDRRQDLREAFQHFNML